VRNLDADPYPPDTYCCPLSLYWLEDAVTPQGYSFSRVRIEQSLCPITRQPLDARQLVVPKRQLQQATDHYRNHHMRFRRCGGHVRISTTVCCVARMNKQL
jgi:hypothetical protein